MRLHARAKGGVSIGAECAAVDNVVARPDRRQARWLPHWCNGATVGAAAMTCGALGADLRLHDIDSDRVR